VRGGGRDGGLELEGRGLQATPTRFDAEVGFRSPWRSWSGLDRLIWCEAWGYEDISGGNREVKKIEMLTGNHRI
jgi:hypothetical protein